MGSTKITKNRNMVVSRCDTGGFTIAQQLEVDEGGKKTKVFMKGAIFVDSLENFSHVVDMLADVRRKAEEIENTQWDDLGEMMILMSICRWTTQMTKIGSNFNFSSIFR